MLFVGNFAKAQTKIGYINFQVLVGQMPEAKTVKSQLDIYQKQFIDQLTSMNNELQTKGQEFQKTSTSMTDAVRSAKQSELQDIQKRMQDYQNDAQHRRDSSIVAGRSVYHFAEPILLFPFVFLSCIQCTANNYRDNSSNSNSDEKHKVEI